MSFQPFSDRVLIKPDEVPDVLGPSGLILAPESAKEAPNTGTILAVGEGRITKDGERIPMQCKPGDRVVFFKYAGQPISFDTYDEDGTASGKQEFLIMNEGEVLGRF